MKITNPLMSAQASGAFGHDLTFRQTRSGPVLVKYSRPDRRYRIDHEAAKLALAKISQIITAFAFHTDPGWIAYAKELGLPPYTACLKKQLTNFWSDQTFATTWPPLITDAPAGPITLSASIETGTTTPRLDYTVTGDGGLITIHRLTDRFPAPTPKNVVAANCYFP